MSAGMIQQWLGTVRTTRVAHSTERARRRISETRERARAVAGYLRDLSSQRAHRSAIGRAQRIEAVQALRTQVRDALATAYQRRQARRAAPASAAIVHAPMSVPVSVPPPQPPAAPTAPAAHVAPAPVQVAAPPVEHMVPPSGEPVDDLMQIDGLDAKDQRQLYIMGITTFRALAEADLGTLFKGLEPDRPVAEWRDKARALVGDTQ